jgi:uncharacterized protein YdhG (YjbR/CyaY superfamily)
MSTKQSARPETVDEYVAAQRSDAAGALQKIREAIRDAAPDAEETIGYGIPLYKLRGKHLIGFAASKGHLSLYVTDSAVLDRFREQLEPFDYAGTKTTIRFSAERPLPPALVKRIVKMRAASI